MHDATLHQTAPMRSRRVWANAILGTIALAAGGVLIYPKVIALFEGTQGVIGVGALANLALLFGGLMFVREAVQAYRRAVVAPGQRPNETESSRARH